MTVFTGTKNQLKALRSIPMLAAFVILLLAQQDLAWASMAEQCMAIFSQEDLLPPDPPLDRNIPAHLLKVDASKIYSTNSKIQATLKSLEIKDRAAQARAIKELELELQRASAERKSEYRQEMSRTGKPIQVPVLIIGAGPQGAIARLVASRLGIESVTVEAAHTLSSQVFGRGGHVFTLNTLSEATLIPGSPVQTPLFTNLRYPMAHHLQSAIISAHAAAGGDLLMESAVGAKSVELLPNDRARVRTSDGLVFETDLVISGIGLPKPRYPVTQKEQIALLKELEAEFLPGTKVPRFQNFDDYLTTAEDMQVGRTNILEPVNGLVVGVIGKGASGNVTIENFSGDGPTELYSGGRARYHPSKLIWLNGFANYEEFEGANIPRYHNSTFKGLWDREDVQVYSGHITQIKKLADGRTRYFLDDQFSKPDSERRSVDLDVAVAATGYENSVAELLDTSAVGIDSTKLRLEPITFKKDGEDQIIARRYPQIPQLLVIGPAAAPFLTPDQAAKRSVAIRNPINLNHTGWKTVEAVTQALRSLRDSRSHP